MSMTAKQDSKPQTGQTRVDLAFPLNTPSGVVKTITFRRGKAREMLAAQRIEADAARRELVLMSMLSEEKLTPEDFEELDLADLADVQSTFQGLFMRPS
jgi:Phage tail assembly chaperone proteins, E, or 41 or 14